jgi:2-iminobutanoate/2-iminopropanoate deaminase
MKQISTNNAPAAIGPYSQAIQAGNFVFVSGQLPVDPATGEFAQGGIKELTRQSLTNIQHILKEAGLTMTDVVKTTVFLADMGDFADMNSVYAEFFQAPYPARSAVAIKTLPKNARVEIECIAAKA